MLKAIFSVLFSFAFVALFVVALLDWAGGCGETYTYANGTQHQGECIGRDTLKSLIKKGINHG